MWPSGCRLPTPRIGLNTHSSSAPLSSVANKFVYLESPIYHFLLTTVNVTKIPNRRFPEGFSFNGHMHYPVSVLHSSHSGKTVSMLLKLKVKGACVTAGKAILHNVTWHSERSMSRPARFCKLSIKYFQQTVDLWFVLTVWIPSVAIQSASPCACACAHTRTHTHSCTPEQDQSPKQSYSIPKEWNMCNIEEAEYFQKE